MTTSSVLQPEVQNLLEALSRLSESQLVIAISQYVDLTQHITNALRVLAAASLGINISSQDIANEKYSTAIANLARRLISRGDPSIVRKLLPDQSSLIDLAICTDAKDILARMIDETTAEECIQAAVIAFDTTIKTQMDDHIDSNWKLDRAAKALARIVSSMPRREFIEQKLITKAQKEKRTLMVKMLYKTLQGIAKVYKILTQRQRVGQRVDIDIISCKVSLLEAAYFVSERLLKTSSKASIKNVSHEILSFLDDDLASTKSGIQSLVDLPILTELLLVRPVLFEMIRVDDTQSSFASLSASREQAKRVLGNQIGVKVVSLDNAAWSHVISSMLVKEEEVESVNGIIDSIVNILPHLAMMRQELARQLQSPEYKGKGTEEIIGMILQQEEDSHTFEERSNKVDGQALNSLKILSERGNIFEDKPLEAIAVTRGKARDYNSSNLELSSGLTDEMRAAIIARAEQLDLEDEKEEWNPFSENVYEVGFEEEMDMERKENFDTRTEVIIGSDNESSEVESAEEGGEIEARDASVHASGEVRKESTFVAAERAVERILIRAWSEMGEVLLKKEARKSSGRVELIKKLNNFPGKKWDDSLVESWATMFARNPRKESLLSSVDDIMRVGNTNRTGEGESSYGPNRGRGGRILTSERGSGRGRGRGGRGRGQSSRSRGQRGGGAIKTSRGDS